MQSLTIQLPDDVQKNLEQLSQQRHQPINELISDSLRRYFALTKQQSLASQAINKAGSDLTDEEAMTLAVQETRAHRAKS